MDKAEITVRRARKADIPALVTMLRALAAHEGDEAAVTEHSLGGIWNEGLWFWLAEHGGRVAGMIAAYEGYDMLSASKGVHLGDFFVHEACRGRGAGRALLAACAAHGLARGARWMQWTLLRDNDLAWGFYEKLEPHVRGDVVHMGLSREQMEALVV